MSFGKFASLVSSKRLHFTRADCFDDPYEGALPDRYADYMKEDAASMRAAWAIRYQLGNRSHPSEEAIMGTKGGLLRVYRTLFFVNCWYMSEHESAAMWAQYTHGEGIAIRSTYGRLKDSIFQRSSRLVQYGCVQYYNYATHDFGGTIGSPYTLILSKRKSFEHEKELRAFMMVRHRAHDERGTKVYCDLPKLIAAVYTSPTSGKWFMDAVGDVMKQFNVMAALRQSDIARGPLW
jgi:hypothetical protein